jgi:hypothetical protein
VTLAQELSGMPLPIKLGSGTLIQLEDPPLRLAFNGELSPDELRMASQCTFDGPASWEEEC